MRMLVPRWPRSRDRPSDYCKFPKRLLVQSLRNRTRPIIIP
jgi:hypothetical protein